MADANLAEVIRLLGRGLTGLCEEISGLRDDLFNHAMLVNGPAMLGVEPLISGGYAFAVADMPGQTTSAPRLAFENKSGVPVLVVVRVEPYLVSAPPNVISAENTMLLLGRTADEMSTARAAYVDFGPSPRGSLLIAPSQRLYVSAIASAAVTASWRGYSLKGRRVAFER